MFYNYTAGIKIVYADIKNCMTINLKSFWSLVKKSFKEWNAKDPFRESAIIAYYAIFSLPALLVIVIATASLFFGREMVTGTVHSQIASTLGPDTAEQVKQMIINASKTKQSVLASIIGIITLLFGATGVFAQLQKSLNIIWEVKADPKKQGILQTLKTRLFSFGLIISIGFLLLISLVVTSMITVLSDWVKAHWPDFIMYLFFIINFVLSLSIVTILFALMFKILPDAKIKWKHVWMGAILTALLFELGKFTLGIYFGKSNPGSVYGAAGSIILILLWVSYSTMILFFGAEFTKANANRVSGEIPATEIAHKDKGRES